MRENSFNNNVNYSIVILKVLTCTLFWAGTFIAGRIVAPYASPAVIGFLRFFVASVFLVLFLELRKDSLFKEKLSLKNYIGVTLMALTGIFAYNLFFIQGLKTIEASRASLMVATNPIVTAILATIFLKERLKLIQYLGIAISIFGTITVLTDGQYSLLFNEAISKGDIAIFMGVIAWVIYSLVGKVVIGKYSPLVFVTWACIIGTLLFFPLAFSELSSVISNMPLKVYLCILYLGICGSAVPFVFFYEVMHVLGATKTSISVSFIPVFATLFGIVFLGEKISLTFIFAGMLILTGVYITNKK